MKEAAPPPRLHVLMRAESPTALVIRQGPTRTFCTIGWNLAKDTFQVGQWVKHKLYPERGDISPDGKWHLYFALNGQWKSETKGTWTGLAKVPYLKCLKMWPQGDTWGGGGQIYAVSALPPALRHLEPEPPLPATMRIRRGSLPEKLERDGWARMRPRFEKRFGRWLLRKRVPGMGFVQEHELVDDDGSTHDRTTWQWAEVDAPRKRLVFAAEGQICAVKLTKPLADPTVLFDANGMTFAQLLAPY